MHLKRFFSKDFLKSNWILIAVVLISAVIRLYRIDGYMTFLGDEGRDALVVYNILHGHLTLLGPTSSVGGFFLGPIYYYFSAPFMLLTNFSPVGPSIMVAILSVITTFFVFKIGEKVFNKLTGLLAAFFYAIAPSVIIASRSSWNPNVMPFFTVSTLYALYLGLKKNNPKLLVLSGILFGITMQLHYLATFVGVIIFLYVLIYNHKSLINDFGKILKSYVLLFVGFLIGFSPFLLFELRHGFTNTMNILNFIFNSPSYTGGGDQLFVNIHRVFLRLFGGLVFNFPLEADLSKFDPNLLKLWENFSLLIGALAFGLLFFQIWQTFKSKSDVFYQRVLILVWIVIGIFLFGFYKKPIYDYYFEFMYPIPFLLVANLVIFIFREKRLLIVGKIAAILLIIVFTVSSVLFSPLRFPPNYQVNQVKNVSELVLSKTDGKPFNFALITGGNSDHAYRFFFHKEGRDPVVIQNFAVDPDRKSVTDQLMVVCELNPCGPLGYSLWEVAGFGRAEIAGQWKSSVLEVYKLVHYKGK